MYENFFPCINPEMMRYTEQIPYNDIYNNVNDDDDKNITTVNNDDNKNVTNKIKNNAIDNSSGCGSNPLGLELARAYMPIQPYVGILPLQEGLKTGSIFPNINLKYPRL